MNNLSMTTSGIFILLLSFIISPSEADTVVNGIIQAADAITPVIGIALAYAGRVRQKDINWYGKKL